MHFVTSIEQSWTNKCKRTFYAFLTLALLTAVGAVGISLFHSEVLAAWNTPNIPEQQLACNALEGLLSLDVPSTKWTQFQTRVKESQKHAETNQAVLLVEHWKSTLSVTDLLRFLFVFSPFPNYSPGAFSPIPAAFIPLPYVGPPTSISGVALYNASMQGLLALDRTGDFLQYATAVRTEQVKLATDISLNAVRFANYAFLMGSIANGVITAVAAIPFIGPPLAVGVAIGTTVYVGNQLQNLANTEQGWTQSYLKALALYNATLNKHLAGDVFTPLVPATPYTF